MKTAFLSIACVLGLAGTARADVPAWCSAEGVKKQTYTFNSSSTLPTTLDERLIPSVIHVTCWPDRDAQSRTAEIEAARATLSKRFAMSEDVWADAAIFFSLERWNQDAAFTDMGDANVAFSKQSAIEQYRSINAVSNDDWHYVVDALGARLTETGRLKYILECVGRSNPVVMAMCQPDIVRLDRTKLAAELAADKHTTPIRRMRIRLDLYALDAKLAKRDAEIKALVAKDAEYGKLFEIAEAVRKEWDGRWKTDAELLDLVLAMDDAWYTESRKASAGCEAKSWPAFQKMISSIPAKRFAFKTRPGEFFDEQAAEIVVFEPTGYLAAVAFHVCRSLEQKPDTLVNRLGGKLAHFAGHRGPRNATHTAIRAANIVLDDRKARIEYPSVNRRWFHGSSTSRSGVIGVVGSTETKGDQITINFPKQMGKAKVCSKTRETKRVTQIRSDGSLVYERECLAYEMESFDSAPPAQTAHAIYADGVKKGVVVEVGDVVFRVWPNANATVPSRVFGAAVK